jgi:hypothetical protein
MRTATRPPMTYDNLGATDTPMGAMPTRLLTQLFRGPDLGFIGVVVLAAVPPGPVPLVVLLVLLGWCLLR